MSDAPLSGQSAPTGVGEAAVARARQIEDVVAGNGHRLARAEEQGGNHVDA